MESRSGIKISFDFDGTLDRKDVQEYCKELIERDFDVYVCTFRTKEYNDDLFKITDELKISRENIIFTEMDDKSNFLTDDFIFHLDDDHMVMYDLRANTKIPCVNVNKSAYKNKCERILARSLK